MGDGDKELGENLLRMHLYTIDANSNLPENIVCMNSGVHVATKDAHTISTLRSLESKGVSIVVCGTCLDYYHLLEELKVGKIGNMYDITTILTCSPKVVSV
jgi:selenium metabolism protein YedF